MVYNIFNFIKKYLILSMSPKPSEGCGTCIHINPENPIVCKAFPRGIPFIIVSGGIEHTKSIKGDNGIVYELNPKFKKSLGK
tara:strand:+ start:388 stop:633 length:246 start_codon:yes stop_codon:yes gene_type:complete